MTFWDLTATVILAVAIVYLGCLALLRHCDKFEDLDRRDRQ